MELGHNMQQVISLVTFSIAYGPLYWGLLLCFNLYYTIFTILL